MLKPPTVFRRKEITTDSALDVIDTVNIKSHYLLPDLTLLKSCFIPVKPNSSHLKNSFLNIKFQ